MLSSQQMNLTSAAVPNYFISRFGKTRGGSYRRRNTREKEEQKSEFVPQDPALFPAISFTNVFLDKPMDFGLNVDGVEDIDILSDEPSVSSSSDQNDGNNSTMYSVGEINNSTFIETIRDLLPKLVGFDIVQYVRFLPINKSGSHLKSSNKDLPIAPGSSMTCEQFSKRVSTAYDNADFNMKDTSKMDELLFDILSQIPESKFPLHKTVGGKVVNSYSQFYSDNLSNYCIEFHVCSCGELVYEGPEKFNDRCKHCERWRWTRCKHCHANGFCPHVSARIPQKTITYRPLIRLIRELLQYEHFRNSLKFVNLDSQKRKPSNSKGTKRQYSDVLDCDVAEEHLLSMELRASEWIQLRQNARSLERRTTRNTTASLETTINDSEEERIETVNLLFGFGYDGAQVFHYRTDHFYPVILSILNLPPSYRKVVSVGSFIISLLNSVQGSFHEQFILRDCLIGELEGLYNGLLFKNINGKSYFVQARLILHMYDTKALEHMAKVRSVSSQNPCPLCRLVSATRNQELDHVIWEGSRYLLDLKHALRSRGQSQQCCPVGYNSPGDITAYCEIIDSRNAMTEPITLKKSIAVNHSAAAVHALSPCEEFPDNGMLDDLKNFLLTSNPYIWYHTSVDYKTFSDSLYYHHCDYRMFVEHTRVSNHRFITDGIFGHKTNNDLEEDGRKRNFANSGVYAVWIFALLLYTEISKMLCWDPFHSLKNILKYLLELITGRRKISVQGRTFCKETRSHPDLYMPSSTSEPKGKKPTKRKRNQGEEIVDTEKDDDNNKKARKAKKRKEDDDLPPPPWVIKMRTILAIDQGMSCVLFPKSYSRDHKVINPMQQFGKLPCVSLLHWLTNFLYFIIYIIRKTQPTYSRAYLGFLAILCDDLRCIQETVFDDNEIKDLYNRIVELVCLQHGLFPITEARIPWHQLIDIVPFIRSFGPIRNWWALGPERAISKVKKRIKKGGPSYSKTTMESHIKHENHQMKNFYSFPLKQHQEHDPFITIDKNCSTIYHSEETIKLYRSNNVGSNNKYYILSTYYEKDGYLTALLRILCHKVKGNLQIGLQHSRILRLWFGFMYDIQNNIILRSKISYFSEWLEMLAKTAIQKLEQAKKLISLDLNNAVTNDDTLLVETIVRQGKLLFCDYYYISFQEETVLGNNPLFMNIYRLPIYSKAMIMGKRFSARGSLCSEVLSHRKHGNSVGTHRKENRLKDNLFNRDHYSSWFQFQFKQCENRFLQYNDNEDDDNDNNETTTAVGQFNFFTKVLIDDEPLLKDVPVASVTCRSISNLTINLLEADGYASKLEQNQLQTDILIVDCRNFKESLFLDRYKNTLLFIPLYDVYSNPLAVIPVDHTLTPLSYTEISNEFKSIASILLIGLSPERKKLTNLMKIENENNSFSTIEEEEEEDDDDEGIAVEYESDDEDEDGDLSDSSY